jgi:hypothetical protein
VQGAELSAFSKKANAAHHDSEIHVVLDNLSTRCTLKVKAWLPRSPHVSEHITPVGSLLAHSDRYVSTYAQHPAEGLLIQRVRPLQIPMSH